ncbi:ABC transporter permease [Gordonia sp. (in: high G+C Gram-positive bacteria)]|uniref:ABC transporter permease n=1 Tax=Gordonia sp. (in: high G+C Gram-positive bacteria) TaxID=84139 RepID=UPI003F9E60E7
MRAPAPGVSPLVASRIFIGRSVRHSIRNVDAMVMAVALPVMLMLVFVFVFGGAISDTASYLDYVVPGIVLTCAGFGASSTGVSVSQDLKTGAIDRLRTMPVPSATVLVGHTVASVVRNLLATIIVVCVAVLLGFRPDTGIIGAVFALGLVAFYILAITSVFAMLGLVAGSAEAASGYGFVILFLPYASSAFVPLDSMPGWLQTFAAHQPVTPVVEATRALLNGQSPGGDAAIAICWCVGIIGAATALTVWMFPRRSAR